jgi:peptide/nickel transport system substrate-binding protein
MEAPDKQTVKITLDVPNADFLWSLADSSCRIVPPETWAVKGDLKEGPIVGSGPFMFTGDWQRGTQFTIRKNPDFFQKGIPYVDSVSFFHLLDTQTIINALRSGNLEAVGVGVSHADLEPAKREAPDLKIYDYSPGTSIDIVFKCDTPPFDDKRVRQAINKGLNRKEIYDTIFQGKMVQYSGLVTAEPSQNLPQAELEKLFAFDADGARKLLADAGKTNIEADLLIPNYLSGQVVQIAELLQVQLKKVGINFNLKVLDGTAWIAQVRGRGEFLVAMGSQTSGRPTSGELYERWYSKSGTLWTKLKDPELDALIDKQATMVKDAAGRAKVIQDIHRRIIDNASYLNVGAIVTPQAARGFIKDWNPNGSNNFSGDLRVIWVDK